MSQRDLVAELRASRMAAPHELRERVRLIADADSTASPRRFTWRRALVVALPVAAAVAASIVFTRPAHHAAQPVALEARVASATHGSVAGTFKAAPSVTATPAPSATRAQRYGAALTLRVPTANGVSNAVKSALRITRSLGGYATSVHAGSKGRSASADLTLKIPRTHVQDAITRLSALGTITGEQVDVQDLQTGLNATERTIARLQRELRDLRAQPASPAHDARIAALVAQVTRLQRTEAATIRAARYATVSLRLATPAAAHHAKNAHGPLHGLVVALKWLGIGLVYALALGLPVLILALFAYLAVRFARRRREDALLSRS
jgi:hypothetical protein